MLYRALLLRRLQPSLSRFLLYQLQPKQQNTQTAPNATSLVRRCPSDKKPKSPVSAVTVSLDEATMAVGCEDGSVHGMKLSQGGVGVQHAWSKPAGAGAGSVLAMDMSTDGKVGGKIPTKT